MEHGDIAGQHAECVAVGWCGGDSCMTNNTITPRAVDDIHRLPQLFFQQRTHNTCNTIGATTGSKRHNQRNRSGRIVICCIRCECRAQSQQRRCNASRPFSQKHRCLLIEFILL